MSKQLVILGSGPLSDEVIMYLAADRHIIYRYDDRFPNGKAGFTKLEVIQTLSAVTICHYVAATGESLTRRKLSEFAQSMRFEPLTVIGQGSIQHSNDIGPGSILAPLSYIGLRARLGQGCLVNYHAIISHDCKLGDFVTIAPNATLCGKVYIDDNAFIGAGAVIRDNDIFIGHDAVIGCGSVVIRDVPPGQVVAGVPAKQIGQT
jgi:sugar O-acyltransferase (sialic acid O-acetyltransferase NeuD family)